MRPVLATVDLRALRHNLRVVRRAAPRARVWAVVKADAYGHGLARVWRALGAADGFAILNVEDACLLRAAGWAGPILMLEGFFHADELRLYDRHRLTTAVHSDWQVEALAAAAPAAPLDVYLKVNSGMNRLGFPPERARGAWRRLRAAPAVGELTLMAHFADADRPGGVAAPLRRVRRAGRGLAGPRSLCNSAATLWHPAAHCDWVRPGVALYGASPSGHWRDAARCGLRPVMTLSSAVIGVQRLRPGDAVGYGGRYRAGAGGARRVGVVAGGYADGYPRSAPDGTPVAVDGVRTRLLGRVSMDMLTVDLTGVPGAGVGSAVELWGGRVHVDEVAAAAGTVGYELMCALAPRVPVVVRD